MVTNLIVTDHQEQYCSYIVVLSLPNSFYAFNEYFFVGTDNFPNFEGTLQFTFSKNRFIELLILTVGKKLYHERLTVKFVIFQLKLSFRHGIITENKLCSLPSSFY